MKPVTVLTNGNCFVQTAPALEGRPVTSRSQAAFSQFVNTDKLQLRNAMNAGFGQLLLINSPI